MQPAYQTEEFARVSLRCLEPVSTENWFQTQQTQVREPRAILRGGPLHPELRPQNKALREQS